MKNWIILSFLSTSYRTLSLFINDGDRARITRRRYIVAGDSQKRSELKNECFVAAILNFKQAVN